MAIPTVSQTILNLSIRHKIGLAGYEAWVVRKVIGLLNSSDADLERQISMALERAAPQDTRERLVAIRKELLAVNGEAYRRMGYFLTKEMRALVTDEVAALADIVEGALPFKFSATRPSAALLHALVTEDPLHGRLLGPHIENLAGNRAAALLEQLQIGTLQGESWGRLLKRVRGTAAGGYRDGVLETIGRRQAETLTRTAVQHFSEAARDRLIQENEDLFQGVMWVNTLDLRTCPRCQVRGGLVWDMEYKPVGHSLEWLGGPGRLHFLDRCTSIPVFRDVEDLEAAGIAPKNLRPGERAAMEGPVPVTHEYEDWLREQPDDVQADALESVARAEEFRSGKSLAEVWDMRFDRRTPAAPLRVIETPPPVSIPTTTPQEEALPVDLVDPAKLDTVNSVDDRNKLRQLVRSMQDDGWRGRPVLIVNDETWTGSHRIHAAREAKIEVPVYAVKIDQEDIEDFGSVSDDDDRLALLRSLVRDGTLGLRGALELMEAEVAENNR